jgi:YfiH family protein
MAQILFTARHGGTSQGGFESFNLGDHVWDKPDSVAKNRELLKNLMSRVSPVFMNQVHGNSVVEVNAESISPIEADALITRKASLPLAVLCADCLPILVKGENVVGAIHAGRKGILNGIIRETISKMRAFSGEKLTATIGPAICGDCYEVDLAMYENALLIEPELATSKESHCLDLKRAARSQLTGLGVEVFDLDICTAHDSNYFSYRRDGNTGRNVGVIVL